MYCVYTVYIRLCGAIYKLNSSRSRSVYRGWRKIQHVSVGISHTGGREGETGVAIANAAGLLFYLLATQESAAWRAPPRSRTLFFLLKHTNIGELAV